MLLLYFLYVAWDIPCILSILAMHHMNFGHKEARSTSVDQESQASLSENLLSDEEPSSPVYSEADSSVNESEKRAMSLSCRPTTAENQKINMQVDAIVE